MTVGTDVKKPISLKDCCVYFDNNRTDDTDDGEVDKFVGIKCINNELKIYFPVGYKQDPNEDDKAIRKNILNLVSVLSSFSEKYGMLTAADILSSSKDVQFPIHAYLFIISDFLNRGYYTKKESQYRKDISGKINWSRTIKHIRPQICNEDAVYFNFITRHTDYNQSQLISQIHRYRSEEHTSELQSPDHIVCRLLLEKKTTTTPPPPSPPPPHPPPHPTPHRPPP